MKIKDQDIADMIKASKMRQKGKDVTSDEIRKRRERRESGNAKPKTISQSTSSVEGGRAQSESGYTPDTKSKPQENKQVKPKKPQRRATGREAMIAERYMNQEEKKKNKQSAIVSDNK